MHITVGFLVTNLATGLDEGDESLGVDGCVAATDLTEHELHVRLEVGYHLVRSDQVLGGCLLYTSDAADE